MSAHRGPLLAALLLAALLLAGAAAAQTPPADAPLAESERLQLVRSAQLAQALGLPEDLPVALCVQAANPHWPGGEPDERQLERWRMAWEHCAGALAPDAAPTRLVLQARLSVQASAQRLQQAWRQRAACQQAAQAQPAQAPACLQALLGRPPSADESRWLLADGRAAPRR